MVTYFAQYKRRPNGMLVRMWPIRLDTRHDDPKPDQFADASGSSDSDCKMIGTV